MLLRLASYYAHVLHVLGPLVHWQGHTTEWASATEACGMVTPQLDNPSLYEALLADWRVHGRVRRQGHVRAWAAGRRAMCPGVAVAGMRARSGQYGEIPAPPPSESESEWPSTPRRTFSYSLTDVYTQN